MFQNVPEDSRRVSNVSEYLKRLSAICCLAVLFLIIVKCLLICVAVGRVTKQRVQTIGVIELLLLLVQRQ